MVNRSILFITYFFPPINSSASIRSANYVRGLSKAGWHIDVLTIHCSPYNNLDPALTSIISNLPNVCIHRTYPGLLDNIVLREKRKIQDNNMRFINEKPKGVSCGVRNFGKRIYKLICVPDKIIGWYPFALTEGIKLFKKNKYDLIFSSCPSLSTHLIANTLKKKNDIPWVMSINDPLSHNPTWKENKLRTLILEKIEKVLLKRVDTIITTTNETRKAYLQTYPFLTPSKIHTVLGGFNPLDFDGLKDEKPNNFRIVYTGEIETTRGSVQPFFQAIKKLTKESLSFFNDLEIFIVGGSSRKEKIEIPNYLKKKIFFLPPVSFRESLKYMLNASILLIWGNRGGLQIPLKVYYYMGAKKPIMIILGDKDDPLSKLLENTDRSIIVNNNELEIMIALKRLYKFYQEKKLDQKFNLSEIKDYTWQEAVKKLERILPC